MLFLYPITAMLAAFLAQVEQISNHYQDGVATLRHHLRMMQQKHQNSVCLAL